jgi:hypothetical protein
MVAMDLCNERMGGSGREEGARTALGQGTENSDAQRCKIQADDALVAFGISSFGAVSLVCCVLMQIAIQRKGDTRTGTTTV